MQYIRNASAAVAMDSISTTSQPKYGAQRLSSLLTLALLCAGAYQLLFYFTDFANGLCVLLVLTASCIARWIAVQPRLFQRSPFHSLVVVSMDLTLLSGPLLAKSMAFQSLTSGLNVPVNSFLLCAATIGLVTFTLVWYDSTKLKSWLLDPTSKRLFVAMKLYDHLSPAQLFAIFFLGMGITLALQATGDSYLIKVADAFSILGFAPALLVLSVVGTGKNPGLAVRRRIDYRPFLALYFVFVAALSVMGNSREGLLAAVVVSAIAVLVDRRESPNSFWLQNPIRLVVLATILLVAFWFFERLSHAMVAVRSSRGVASGGELFWLTLSAFLDTDWLLNYSLVQETVGLGRYDESYIDSRLFARFIQVKFIDNFLFYSDQLGPEDLRALWDYRVNSVLALMPRPMLEWLSLSIDKDERYSTIDFILSMTDGMPLGGYKSGSIIADIWIGFDLGILLIVPLFALMLFATFDFFSLRVNDSTYFCPILFLMAWKLFGTLGAVGFGSDSVVAIPGLYFRFLPQAFVAFLLTSILARMLIKDHRS